MSEANHTPGQWFPDQSGVVTDRDGREVATVAWLTDLHLVASAPELLAQLRELVQQVQGFQDCNGDKGFVLSDALAVIAKAEGGVL